MLLGNCRFPLRYELIRSWLIGMLLPLTLLLLSGSAWAQYPSDAGNFVRSDGVVVTARTLEGDGVIARTGNTCWFELSNGASVKLVAPNRSLSCVILPRSRLAEIYWYRSDMLPVANRVEQFDGHAISDITTPSRRWFSPLLHTYTHWVSYLVALVLFSVLLLFGFRIMRATPHHSWWRVLQGIWILAGILLVAVYSLYLTMYSAVSPPVLFVLAGMVLIVVLKFKKPDRDAPQDLSSTRF